MGQVSIRVKNGNGEWIPNFPIAVWPSSVQSTAPTDFTNSFEVNTGPSGLVAVPILTSEYVWILPKPYANWSMVLPSPVSAQKFIGAEYKFSEWFAEATVKPNKPNITAEFFPAEVVQVGYEFRSIPNLIRVTHTNDITKYENDTRVYYNTTNNFATATQESQYNSSHPIIWKNDSIDPVTQLPITTIDFLDNVLLGN